MSDDMNYGFIEAVYNKNLEKTKFYFGKGVNVNINTYDIKNCEHRDKTSLMIAVENNDMEMVKLLVSYNVDVNMTRENDELNVLFLINDDNISLIDYLIDNGLNINSTNGGLTALMFIICDDKLQRKAINYLLDKGIDTNISDYYYKTALDYALEYGNYDIVKLLLEKREYNLNDLAEETICVGDTEMLQILLDMGADIKCIEHTNGSLLLIPFINSDLEMMKMLISNGADVNITHPNNNFFGNSILYDYNEKKQLEAVQLLIDNGADVNKLDNDGFNVLWHSFYINDIDYFKLLLNNGIDVNIKNGDGDTILDRAVKEKMTQFVKSLLIR